MFAPRMFQQDSYATLEKVLQFTEQRQHLLANNIANVATPFYKRRDLDVADFTETLNSAINRSKTHLNNQYDFYDGAHTKYKNNTKLKTSVQIEKGVNMLRHDENNADIEREMVAMAKNAMMNRAAGDLLRQKNAILAQAISLRIG